MAKLIGVKGWWADGTKRAVRVKGRPQVQVAADLALWPAAGFQIGMIYYDKFSVDGLTRHRRIVQGNDYYGFYYDSTPPPALRDWLVLQTNRLEDFDNYPGIVVLSGSWVNDNAYKVWNDEAMADMRVSDLGETPKPGTSDS